MYFLMRTASRWLSKERLVEVVSGRRPQRAEGSSPPGREEIYFIIWDIYILMFLSDPGKPGVRSMGPGLSN